MAFVVLGLIAVGVAVATIVRSRQQERSAPALCERLSQAQDLDASLTTLDPATLAPQVQSLDRAKAVAPADVRASVVTLADFVSGIADEVEGADGDRRAALADALASRQDQVDAVGTAGREVQMWARDNCGISLGGPPAPAGTPGATAGPVGG